MAGSGLDALIDRNVDEIPPFWLRLLAGMTEDETRNDEPESSQEDDPTEAENDEAPASEGDEGTVDISDTPAPSIGPNTTIEREDPDERLARHEQSDVDAMGLDKRREVVGGSYSPSIARQAAMYGIFILVVAAIAFGFKLAVDEFDQPEENYKAEAPWTDSDRPPEPLQ